MENKHPQYIVVVGTSAGGLNSIIELAAQLKEEVNVSVLVVMHLSKTSIGELMLYRIQKNTSYKCKIPDNGEQLKRNHIYLAPPDRHMLVKDGHILLGQGPTENRWRPSIDVLFRSAAANHGAKVIGVVLTGLMQDGTSGMETIKRCGGTTIVQDPNEAEYPEMPLSVLNNMQVDYCVSLASMGEIISEITKNGKNNNHPIPADVKAEAEIEEKVAIGIDAVAPLGNKSLFTCPDCGGGLWELSSENNLRYRCHVGHVYTQTDLLVHQRESLESTLWIALRMMEERRNLLLKMSEEEKSKGWLRIATDKKNRAEELKTHIDNLKEILFKTQVNDLENEGK